MAIRKDEAIVLGRRRLQESSLIVDLFTRHAGRLRVVAKGARRTRSRFSGVLEPTTVVQVVYYEKETRDLQLLTQADLVESYSGLRESLLRLSYGYAIIESLIGMKREESGAETLFRLARETFREIDAAAEDRLEAVLWRFLLLALEDTGFKPELEQCLACGRVETADEMVFDSRAGGVLCRRHGAAGLALSLETREVLIECARGSADRSPSRGRVTAEGREAIRRFLVEHGLGRSPFRPLEDLIRS
ncbi:MAG: DNA repair protein RecO [Gemmatimonadetes bacterium]|nr:DNA repair protein RecO [Gemmatimonadota bacterium]